MQNELILRLRLFVIFCNKELLFAIKSLLRHIIFKAILLNYWSIKGFTHLFFVHFLIFCRQFLACKVFAGFKIFAKIRASRKYADFALFFKVFLLHSMQMLHVVVPKCDKRRFAIFHLLDFLAHFEVSLKIESF